MSLGKLKRQATRLQVSNRIKAHAQREAAATIDREHQHWLAAGEIKARWAMTRLVVPAQDERAAKPTLLNKRPEQPVLIVPLMGRRYANFADAHLTPQHLETARFEYRPMELRVGERSIVWWDLMPMSPMRDRETLADEVLRLSDELRSLDRHGQGYVTHLADKLDLLVARMRLVTREDRLADPRRDARQAG